MADTHFTLTSYDPVYVVCPEVRIPESEVKSQAMRWLELNIAKDGEKPKMTDQWIKQHVEGLNNVDELLIFIRYNMYKDNREIQELSDQNYICAELAKRLVEDLPEDFVEECLYASRLRLEDMVRRSGKTIEDFAAERGMTTEQLYSDVDQRAIQSLREDSALAAYADMKNYTLEAEDFYAIIPGNSIEEKAYKRRQIEADGRLAGMEDYARKNKALREVMENAMVKRDDDPSLEYVRYGDVSSDVLEANKQFPDAFQTI